MDDIRKQSRSRELSLRVMVLAIFAGGSMSALADTLYISKLATYGKAEEVREKVRTECTPEALFPEVMREEILNRTTIQNVDLTDNISVQKEGLAMDISILSLEIPPGTGWSSEKRFMKVKSVLYRNGVIAAEIERYSNASGGRSFVEAVFKIPRGSCKTVTHLARDISQYTVERFKAMNLLPANRPAEAK